MFGGGPLPGPLIRAQMVPAVHDLSRYGHLRNACRRAATRLTAAQSPVKLCSHHHAPENVVGVVCV